MMQFESGPFLKMAVFCDRVIEEKDGVLSLVRVVDRYIQTASGPNPPEQMPPFPAQLTMVVMLSSGSARGPVEVEIEAESPSGLKHGLRASLTALMEGEDRGANLVFRIGMTFEEPGLYWFSVLIEKRQATRVPLRVMYQRTVATSGSTPAQEG